MRGGEQTSKGVREPALQEKDGLVVSFASVAAVVDARAKLTENGLKIVESAQAIDRELIDAKIESMKANQGLAAAAAALWLAFHPRQSEDS